jgi:hypothetical protein
MVGSLSRRPDSIDAIALRLGVRRDYLALLVRLSYWTAYMSPLWTRKPPSLTADAISEKRQELPFHRSPSMTGMGRKATVRFGRWARRSGHSRMYGRAAALARKRRWYLPFALTMSAKSGLIERSKMDRYSITSSARASSAGTVMPSAFAVLRLITSSNLVGCWTGRSAGFSPLST